jgi:hypothetical protein
MTKISLSLGAVFLLLSSTVFCQVLAPREVRDPGMRALQTKYLPQLQNVGSELAAHNFEYPFYFSRALDLDEVRQKRSDQRSLRFEKFRGLTVVEITGNYYAAYPGRSMDRNQRAMKTLFSVMMPILQSAVPQFQNAPEVQGYALEISHHVLGNVMDVTMERPENFALILPKVAAQRFIAAKNVTEQQAAVLEGQTFIDTEPIAIYLNGNAPPEVAKDNSSGTSFPDGFSENSRSAGVLSPDPAPAAHTPAPEPGAPASAPNHSANNPRIAEIPLHDSSPQALSALQNASQTLTATIVRQLDAQAHLTKYAAPQFIPFRKGAYLQLSMTTDVATQAANSSQYKLAALSFDHHISHLVRPLMALFKDPPNFDGVDFSTALRTTGQVEGTSSEAVEFVFPFGAMRCYENYDCTGQQLIDSGVVLINGERVGLQLQTAEADGR